MGKGADGSKAVDMAAIDPDLIPLFQRIFPDRDPVNRYADLASKFKNADNRTKYRLSVLMDLDDVRMKIDKALNGSHEEMLAALGGRGMESDRPSVATVLNSYLRNASGPNKQKKRFGNPTKNRRIRSADRKQFFEEGELVDIEGSVPRHRNQSDYHTFTKITDAYWKIINHAKKMRDPRFIDADKKKEWLVSIFTTPIEELPETVTVWRNKLIDWLKDAEGNFIVTTHFMVINALVSHITTNDVISYFHPDYASRTEIFIRNGELTQLILGDNKKTVINL